MKLSLNAAHRAACTSALSFATGIWSNDFSAIERVPFEKSAARTMVGRETFGDRIRDAVMEFTDSKTHFDISATMLDAGSAASKAVAIGGSEPAAFEESEAYALRDALELLARVHTGQMHILIEGRAKQSSDWGHILYDLWLHRCAASLGIHHPAISDDARVAWDLYRIVRGHLAWKRQPAGGLTTDFDCPISPTSISTGLATAS